MRIKTNVLLFLPLFLLALTVFSLDIYAIGERKVLSRSYNGLEVEVYAPNQCYPNENITVRVRVEALEDVKNASVTLFIWSSKSGGQTPWGTTFTVLEVTNFPSGTSNEKIYNITIPSGIDPGLTYGILFLDWSIYRSPIWEGQWDKASFRMTYVKNNNYEELQTIYSDLQDKYNSVLGESQNIRTLMYLFLITTIALTFSTAYFAKRKPKGKRKQA